MIKIVSSYQIIQFCALNFRLYVSFMLYQNKLEGILPIFSYFYLWTFQLMFFLCLCQRARARLKNVCYLENKLNWQCARAEETFATLQTLSRKLDFHSS